MQETQVRSLDREDPLEKEIATYSSILAWKVPWTKEQFKAGYSSWGLKVGTRLSDLNHNQTEGDRKE